MLILCFHMYYAVYYVMEFIARSSGNNSLTAFWLNTMTDVDDIMVLTSPVCLFILRYLMTSKKFIKIIQLKSSKSLFQFIWTSSDGKVSQKDQYKHLFTECSNTRDQKSKFVEYKYQICSNLMISSYSKVGTNLTLFSV